MEWLHPIAHYAWIGVAAIVALFVLARRRHRRDRSRFGSEETVNRLVDGDENRRHRLREALIVAGVAMLTLALAGPRFGSTPREVTRSGLDLVIALDVSASMLAEDVAPSRIDRMRHELKKLADQLPGDRLALVTFAGDAFLQMPLTSDRSAFRMFIDIASSDQIPTPGTDFLAMLGVSHRAFARTDFNADRSRVLLIVSDGENHVDGVDAAVRELKNDGIEIFTLGVGGREGARIPARTAGGGMDYRRDRSGEYVRTRLQDEVLRRISGADRYFEIGRSTTTFEEFPRALERLQRTEVETAMFEDYDEWYQWPLLVGLLLLGLERVIPGRSRRRKTALYSNV